MAKKEQYILTKEDYQFNKFILVKKIDMLTEDYSKTDKITFEVCITNPKNNNFAYVIALLDTGATFTGISPRIKEKLELESNGQKYYYKDVQGNTSETDINNVQLEISGINYIFDVESAITPTIYDFCDVILGMDIIKQCDLRIEKGKMTLDY